MAGPNDEALFPVFWADSPTVSFLSPSAAFRQMMADTGFIELMWNDVTEFSIERGRKQQASSGNNPPAIGLHLFISDLPLRAANTLRGWENGTYEDICAVFTL